MYFEEKPMIPLTDNEKVLYDNEKQCYICEKEFFADKTSKDYKNKFKVRETIVILQVNIVVLLIVYVI